MTAIGILNSVNCTAHICDNFNSVFNKEMEKVICVCAV